MRLASGLSILFIFSKNQILVLLIFASISFISFSFISTLKFMIYFLLLTLEKAMAPYSSTLPGKSHGRRSLMGCSPWGCEESDTTGRLHFHFSISCIGEGNGKPLQCSCLENPRDGEPGGLPSMESYRVGHDWSDLAAAAADIGVFCSSFSSCYRCRVRLSIWCFSCFLR